MVKLLRVIAIVACISIFPDYVFGASITTQCADREIIEGALKREYNESIFFVGVFSDNRRLLHFFANKKTSTWSIVSLDIHGIYCILLFGDGLTLYNKTERQHAETY